MWVLMMIGMMVPSAAPMVLVFARYSRQRRDRSQPYTPAGAFLAGYLIVWTLFSLGATTLQWALDRAALLSPMMVSTSPSLGGGILIVAGVFQLTPYKSACLKHCRSPLEFFMKSWRSGVGGALRMGFEHGVYCTGCCWILMCILFVGGVMSLLWIGGITIFVLAEKLAPFGISLARVSGVALILGGTFVVLLS
jgi:predicted metal-binding membrane protein